MHQSAGTNIEHVEGKSRHTFPMKGFPRKISPKSEEVGFPQNLMGGKGVGVRKSKAFGEVPSLDLLTHLFLTDEEIPPGGSRFWRPASRPRAELQSLGFRIRENGYGHGQGLACAKFINDLNYLYWMTSSVFRCQSQGLPDVVARPTRSHPSCLHARRIERA